MLRDRIVIGVRDQRLQQKLLEVKDLTVMRAVDICRAGELSREHIKMLSNTEVQQVHGAKTTTQPASAEEGKVKYPFNRDRSYIKSNRQYNSTYYLCKKCNSEHGPRQCPAYGKTCTKCKKMNHFARGCTASHNKVNNINFDTSDNKIHDL